VLRVVSADLVEGNSAVGCGGLESWKWNACDENFVFGYGTRRRMVALGIGADRWGCCCPCAHLSSFVLHPQQAGSVPRNRKLRYVNLELKLGARGHGPWRLALGCEDFLELKRAGQFTMAGSTCFHSSSLVQRDGRFSPSGFWGIELAGFRGSSYASCKPRLKIRKNHESVGFTCFSESDGTPNVRVARARTVESLETTSPGMLAAAHSLSWKP